MSGYSTGTNNQTTSDGTYSYTYDDEGNRLTKTNIITSAKEEYTWDHRNRLTKVTYKNSSNVVTATVEYQYDYQNRMVVRTEDTDGPGSSAATDQVFSYLGQRINPLLEFDGASGSDVSARNLWGPVVDHILAVEKVTTTSSPGNIAWAYSDHLGTPRDLADYNSGTDTVSVSNHRIIDGFGRLTSQTNGSFTITQQVTGKPFDPMTGYGYYLNRSYDPTIGKWLSEDPIGFKADDSNLQRYVRNSVLTRIDPAGLVDVGWEEIEPGKPVFEGFDTIETNDGPVDFFFTVGGKVAVTNKDGKRVELSGDTLVQIFVDGCKTARLVQFTKTEDFGPDGMPVAGSISVDDREQQLGKWYLDASEESVFYDHDTLCGRTRRKSIFIDRPSDKVLPANVSKSVVTFDSYVIIDGKPVYHFVWKMTVTKDGSGKLKKVIGGISKGKVDGFSPDFNTPKWGIGGGKEHDNPFYKVK